MVDSSLPCLPSCMADGDFLYCFRQKKAPDPHSPIHLSILPMLNLQVSIPLDILRMYSYAGRTL